MKKVVDDLIKYGEVQRGLLGVQIQDVNNQIAEKEGLKDVKGYCCQSKRKQCRRLRRY